MRLWVWGCLVGGSGSSSKVEMGSFSSSLVFVEFFARISEVCFRFPRVVRTRIAFPFDEVFITVATSVG